MGALNKSPSNKAKQPTNDPSRIQSRIDYLKKLRPKDPEIAKLQAKLGGLQTSTPGAGDTAAGPSYDSINGQANQGINTVFDQIQNQGAFNPGDFEQQRQGAYDSVMNQFNRSMDPVFDHQNEEFEQRMSAQGVAPGTERYNYERTQNDNAQNTARQNAQDSAYGQGMQAQSQAWNQAASQYQMPYQNLNSFSPFYQMQGQERIQGQQNEFQRELAKLQQKYNMQQLSFQAAHRGGGGGGGGGGGLSFDQQMQLQDRQFYNAAALQAGQMPGSSGPSVGNAAAQGIAQGIGAGIGQGLIR